MCGDCPPFVSLLRAVIAYLCKTIPVAKEEARWKETFCETSPISPNIHTHTQTQSSDPLYPPNETRMRKYSLRNSTGGFSG